MTSRPTFFLCLMCAIAGCASTSGENAPGRNLRKENGVSTPPQAAQPMRVEFLIPQGEVRGVNWIAHPASSMRTAAVEGRPSQLVLVRNGQEWAVIDTRLLIATKSDQNFVAVSVTPVGAPQPFRRVISRIESLLDDMGVAPQGTAKSDLERWKSMDEPKPRPFAYTYRANIDIAPTASMYLRIWAVDEVGWVFNLEISNRLAG